MRPIRIEMHAFGPFGDTQVVDLRELGDVSLFHLSGPTGAGKTFIMDGLFFGLFGEACGKEAPGRGGHQQPLEGHPVATHRPHR